MRGLAKLAAAAALACACGFDSSTPGEPGDVVDTTGTATTTTAGESTSGSTVGSATNGMTGGTTTMAESSEASSDPVSSTTGTQEGETEAPVEYKESCKQIQMEDAGALSGRYEIAPAGAVVPTPIPVYCDMAIDGGGWTLVARSVDGGFDQGEFGWGSARGDVEDPTMPYSLNAKSAGLQFTQVLVGDQGGGYEWGGHVYRFDVDGGFLGLVDGSVETTGLTRISGDCESPAMLEHAGYTADTLVYWFRDQSGFERYGLWHDGFDLYGPWSEISPCDHGADLHDDQGMVMVR